MISIRHREELHLRAVVIPTWVYAILWRSSFVYTSALIRRSRNSTPHCTQDYQSHSARPYKQRKTPTSEHSGIITLHKLILAPPRGDDIYISFSYYFLCINIVGEPILLSLYTKIGNLLSVSLLPMFLVARERLELSTS